MMVTAMGLQHFAMRKLNLLQKGTPLHWPLPLKHWKHSERHFLSIRMVVAHVMVLTHQMSVGDEILIIKI
jgi:hypothetical protein